MRLPQLALFYQPTKLHLKVESAFDEKGHDPRFGYFTCLIDVKDASYTEKAFRKTIMNNKKNKKLFSRPVDIYLDAIVQIEEVPKQGVVTWYSSYHEDGLSRISISPPDKDTGKCMSLEYLPDNRPDIIEKIEKEEEHECEPFVKFT